MCGTPECYSATAASICIVGNEDCDKGEKKDTLYHVGWFLVSVGFGSVVLCEYGLVLYTEPATTGQYRPRQNPAQRAAMRLEIYLRMDVTSKITGETPEVHSVKRRREEREEERKER